MAQQDYVEQDTQDTRALVPVRPTGGMLRPIDTAAAAKAAIAEYEALKTAIITEKDKQKIGEAIHIKKSGWLRIARAFGITVERVSETYEVDSDTGDWGYSVVMRAVAPNGASMIGDGACWASEKVSKPWIEKGKTEPTAWAIVKAAAKTKEMQTRHNVRAHAFTRASNRAISNLVGGGEVSAEEINGWVDEDEAPHGAGSVTPVEPRKGSSQQFHPDVMRLSQNHDVLNLLGDIGVKDTTEQRKKLNEIRIWLGERGKVFDVIQVKSVLNAQLSRMGIGDEEAVIAELPPEEMADLRELPVGQRGN